MPKYENDLSERLLKFAVDVILYLRTVKNTVETMDMKRQLVKSSTSSGANYEESQGSPTRPDAKTKIGISLKEMREIAMTKESFKKGNIISWRIPCDS